MSENKRKDYTIINDDEDIIGKVEDIREMFIDILIKALQDSISTEEKILQITLVQDILEQLENEDKQEIIKVGFNPMGAYYYKHLNWED